MLKPKSPLKSFYGYYGTGGDYDTTGGYYGRLWRIGVTDGETDPMDIRHTWDAGGNLQTRYDALTEQEEIFSYDFLDRLTSVSGAYSASFSYDEIGNILTRNGVSYSYDGTQPHAVDSVGGTSYSYDNNGNMTARGSQTITWDQENRPVSISGGATFVYDGDGNRVKKTEGGETILYINKYYEKNLTTGNITTSYYLSGRLVAQREGTTLRYVHQDHLTGTALMTDTNGDSLGTIKYYPYGSTHSGSVPTDRKFTGQRLDDTGLYYYGARYYDDSIGRFISADTIIPNPANPQAYNRYSYVLNNPLKYIDPSGHVVAINGIDVNYIDFLLQNSNPFMFFGGSSIISSKEYRAYYTLRTVAGDLTNLLEGSDKILNIGFGDLDQVNGGKPIAKFTENSNGNMEITINNIHQNEDIRILAAVMGHESFHAAVTISDLSRRNAANEAFAHGLAVGISRKLDYKTQFGEFHVSSFLFEHINPYTEIGQLQTDMKQAAQDLYGLGYKRQFLGFIPIPWAPWGGFCGSERDAMINLAKDIWVK